MKNFCKIIFYNLIALLLFLILFEIIILCKVSYDTKGYKNFSTRLKECVVEYTKSARQFVEIFPICEQKFRHNIDLTKKSKKAPVVLIIDSIPYGYKLTEKQSLGYKLHKLTGRDIYNFSYPGWSIQHFLWLMRHNKFFEKIHGEPEYIIYFYQSDHKKRLFMYQNFTYENNVYLRYKIISNESGFKLNEIKYPFEPFYFRLYTTKYIQKKLEYKKRTIGEIVLLHFLIACNKEMTKKYPNTKFVIFNYDPFLLRQINVNTDFYFHKETFDLLKKQNIEIINLTDIIDKNLIDIKTVREYYTDSFHPSEKYWDIFTPAIIKYLNL